MEVQLEEVVIDGQVAKIIPECNGKYALTREGIVYSFWSGKPKRIRAWMHSQGYPMAKLTLGKKCYKVKSIHKLVAQLFLPPPTPEQQVVRHRDGDPTNPCADNLEWGTQADNIIDRDKMGRGAGARLERRLGESEEVELIQLLVDGKSMSEIGQRFNIRNKTIISTMMHFLKRHGAIVAREFESGAGI